MGYSMALDGGGTKTLAIIFDEEFNLLGMGRSGGMNTNFETMESVKAHLAECLYACLEAAGVNELDHFFCAGPGPYPEAEAILRQRATLKADKYETVHEGLSGAYAGLAADRGVNVLAGTGSRIDYIDGDPQFCTGGWGGFIGDEGSGCWIGTHGIQAAIASHDGWGPKSVLEDLIMEEWELEKLNGVVPRVFHGRSMRVEVSSVSPLVGKAARMGDIAAIDVLKGAAEILSRQTLAMYRNHNVDPSVPVIVSGSAWKSAPVMFDHFCDLIHAELPDTQILKPIFDPIMGGVIKLALKGRHAIPADELEILKKNFAQFMCNW